MNKPILSIITPTYNAGSTIGKAIESVANQHLKEIEHVIIDGVSEDDTVEIIRSYQKKYTHIRFISEPDRGAYEAMNKGIDLSSGEWIYFLGADDVLVNEHILQELYDEGFFFQEKVFYGNVIIEGETAWAKDQEVYAGEFDLPKLLKRNICHQAIFYPRNIIQKAGFFNTDYVVCADWDYNMRCYAIQPFVYTEKIIARFKGGGLSSVKKETIFGREFPGNIIRYFGLDPEDPESIAPGSPFRSVIRSYHKLKKENDA